jgi:hypothetical protein
VLLRIVEDTFDLISLLLDCLLGCSSAFCLVSLCNPFVAVHAVFVISVSVQPVLKVRQLQTFTQIAICVCW